MELVVNIQVVMSPLRREERKHFIEHNRIFGCVACDAYYKLATWNYIQAKMLVRDLLMGGTE